MLDADAIEVFHCDVCDVWFVEQGARFRLGDKVPHVLAWRGLFTACEACTTAAYFETTRRRRGAPWYILSMTGQVVRASKKKQPHSVPEHLAVLARLAVGANYRRGVAA